MRILADGTEVWTIEELKIICPHCASRYAKINAVEVKVPKDHFKNSVKLYEERMKLIHVEVSG